MSAQTNMLLSMIFATCIIFIFSSESNSESSFPINVKKLLMEAGELYEHGKFDEAKEVYLKIIIAQPGNYKALSHLGKIALYQNKPEEAEKYFQVALNHASWLKKMWPFDVGMKQKLGMIYYRMDRFSEAAGLADEAGGPILIGPFKRMKSYGEYLHLIGKGIPYAIDGPEETRLDLKIVDPLPVVEVSVNGSKPLHFLIDTGGAEIIIDTELAKEVGAKLVSEMKGQFAGGKKAAVGLGKVDSIKIGDYIVRNVPINTLDFGLIAKDFKQFNVDVRGVVGTRFLMHFISTIDYKNGALILRRKTEANLQYIENKIQKQEAKTIPFWLIDTHYILAWGTINGKEPMLFFVDTGLSGKGFTAPESVLNAAGVKIDWNEPKVGAGGGGKVEYVDIMIDELTLGSGVNEIKKYNILGSASRKSVSVLGDKFGFPVGGLVSHQFFRDYALTFDFVGMRLILQ